MAKMKKHLFATVAVSLLACVSLTAIANAGSYTVTVTATTDGLTEKYIGGCEGGSFDVSDLTALGYNNLRIYAKMAHTEPVDDDGVYGSPTIAEIKADPDVIPWSVWDTRMHADYQVPGISIYDMLYDLENAGLIAVYDMRHVNPSNEPAWAETNLNPPTTTDDWNEWWEHVFATVYWINVRNDLGVHDWQVHNEPNNASQGWNGTLDDYVTFTQYTADAIQYVYDTYLPGESFKLYAPVVSGCNSDWMQATISQNDAIVDVLNSHKYGDPVACAQTMQNIITNYDTDSIHEDAYLSEWGTYSGDYASFSDAMTYGEQLMSHSLSGSRIDGSAIFVTWDWGGINGILDSPGNPTATYYAFRLLIRGLQGGKQKVAITESAPRNVEWIAAIDQPTNTMYVTFKNHGGGAKDQTITLDVSAHATSGTVTYYKFADGVNDEVVGTDSLSNGVVVFTLAKSTFFQVEIPVGPPPPTPTPTTTPTEGPSPTPSDTPLPSDTPEPTNTPGGGGTTIFFDDFEDGDMSDWTLGGGDAQIRSDYPYEGNYCAGSEAGDWFMRTISTAGYTGIHLKYAGMTRNMDAGESLTVEWYDGSQWYVIDQMLSNDVYILRDWTLPSGAENNADFAIRFTGDSDRNKEWGYADIIEVTGE
jgi:hypothetical protein